MAENGINHLLCSILRSAYRHGVLKIDTNTDTVIELDAHLLPEQGRCVCVSCVTAIDGCIHILPCNARRTMKVDPNNNDAISSVGDDLGRGSCKYIGTAVGIDRCMYGMPCYTNRIVKYDPMNDITAFFSRGS